MVGYWPQLTGPAPLAGPFSLPSLGASQLRMTAGAGSAGTVVDMNEMQRALLIAASRAAAIAAHAGVVNRYNGEPYIEHPRRVVGHADRLLAAEQDLGADQWAVAVSAAWLHDVLEDTDVSAEDLRDAGVTGGVLEVVELLTRRDDVPASVYYERICEHRLARIVKLADLADNTDPVRRAALEPRHARRLAVRYVSAYEALGQPAPQHLLDDVA